MDQAFAEAATGKRKSGQRLSRAAHVRKIERRKTDAEAKARHKAEKWAKVTMQQRGGAANAEQPTDNLKAKNLPAHHPS